MTTKTNDWRTFFGRRLGLPNEGSAPAEAPKANNNSDNAPTLPVRVFCRDGADWIRSVVGALSEASLFADELDADDYLEIKRCREWLASQDFTPDGDLTSVFVVWNVRRDALMVSALRMIHVADVANWLFMEMNNRFARESAATLNLFGSLFTARSLLPAFRDAMCANGFFNDEREVTE